jgi:hypothetical protein
MAVQVRTFRIQDFSYSESSSVPERQVLALSVLAR